MSQQIINIGTEAGAGDGDDLRTAFDKTNQNFTDIYSGNVIASNILVYSVSGRVGNVQLTTQDVPGVATQGDLVQVRVDMAANSAADRAYTDTVISNLNNVQSLNLTSGTLDNVLIGGASSGSFDSVGVRNTLRANIIVTNISLSAPAIAVGTLGIGGVLRFPDNSEQTTAALPPDFTSVNNKIAATNANVVAANASIVSLAANAATQEIEITGLRANINAANSAIGAVTGAWMANAAAQGLQINALTANAAFQETEITGLRANITAANSAMAALVGSGISDTNANVAAANAAIAVLQSNAIAQEGSITSLRANVSAANLVIIALTSNAAVQETEISGLRANITAANANMSAMQANAAVQAVWLGNLQTNAAVQAVSLSSLVANAAVQETEISGLRANVNAANTTIAGVFSTVSAHSSDISTLYANAGSQATQIIGLRANITAANTVIVGLTSNAATQATELAGLRGNITAANAQIVNLYANAAAQATAINSVKANVVAANAQILLRAPIANPNFTGIVTAPVLTVVGNINSGNVVTGNVTADYVQGTLTTSSQPNITSLGTLAGLTVDGAISAIGVSASNLIGTLQTALQPRITRVGTLTELNSSGNIIAANIVANSQLTAADVVVNGNVRAGNAALTGAFTASSVSASSLTGTLQTASQTNITDVGILNSLTVNGPVNISGSEIVSENMYVTGNLYVAGNTTIIDTKNITTGDLTITLANGAATAGATNGAGIIVDVAGASITYNQPANSWVLNRRTIVSGNLVAGNVSANIITGNASAIAGSSTIGVDLLVTGNITTAKVTTGNIDLGATGITFSDGSTQTVAASVLIATSAAVINANITAANSAIGVLQSNAAAQATEINGLRGNITAANSEISNLRGNITAANSAISALTSNAAVQSQDIDLINANVIAANAAIASTDANVAAANAAIAAIGTGNLADINANVAAANAAILVNTNRVDAANAAILLLDANLGTATTNITTLFGNAATQATAINDLRANVTAANSAISSINSNVTAANSAISSINSNVSAANSAISSINSNVTAANSAISSINSNVSAANSEISNLRGNITAANSEISNLRANVTAANAAISSTNSNVAAANAAISSTNSNVAAANSQISLRAPIASPTFTGTVNATTLIASGNISSANIVTGNVSASGNITAANFVGNIIGTLIGSISSGSDASFGNITATGNIAATGNVTSGYYVNGATGNFNNIYGLIQSPNQPIINTVGTLTTLGISGNITSVQWILASGGATFTEMTGTLKTNAQPYIESIGNLTTANVAGNILAGNVTANSTVIATNLQGTLLTANQPNITHVGTLDIVNTTGNVTSANLTTGNISASGNISVQNIFISGAFALGGNSVAANVSTGNISATGNITTGQNIIAVGNITSGNLAVTGNITAAGISITGGAGVINLGTGSLTAGSLTGNLNSVYAVVSSTDDSYSTASGALLVYGGVGIAANTFIGGNLNVAANSNVTGNLNLTGNAYLRGNANIGVTGGTNYVFGTLDFRGTTIQSPSSAIALFTTATTKLEIGLTASTVNIGSYNGTTTIFNQLAVVGNILANLGTSGTDSNTVVWNNLTIKNTAIASNLIANASTLAYANVTNRLSVDATLASTGPGTGAFVVAGGVGITGAMNIGATNSTTSNVVVWGIQDASSVSTGVTGGALRVAGGASIGNKLQVGGWGIFANVQNSTGNVSGALQVAGGASVAKDLYVGGSTRIYGGLQVDGTLTIPTISLSSINGTPIGNAIPSTATFTQLALSVQRPIQQPVVRLDFANGKKLDSRITYTRNSVATYVDTSGNLVAAPANQPRFTHNSTLQCLGLMIEESRTNLQTYSYDLANQVSSAWVTLGATTSIAADQSPDGTSANAVVISEDSSTGYHGIAMTSPTTVTNGNKYTASVMAKAGTRTQLSLIFDSEGTPSVFNLQFGNITSEGTNYRSQIDAFANGWYRCSSTVSKTNTSGNVTIAVASGGAVSYTGGGSSSVLEVAFFQLEAGAFVTSYIPTAGTQVTRAADVATVTSAYLPTMSRVTQGGIMADVSLGYRTTDFIPLYQRSTVLSLDDGTANNRIQLLVDHPNPPVRSANLVVFSGGTLQANVADLGNLTTASSGKIGMSYSNQNFFVSLNANAASQSLSGTVPAMTQMTIGTGTGTNALNGTVSKIIIYGSQITTSEAQELSRQ